MTCDPLKPLAKWRLVGDPIDVVTGANAYFSTDLEAAGPLPFRWRRYYDSSQASRLCPHGWGHSHEYDTCLKFDLDGLRYLTPVGKAVSFPPLLKDGEEARRAGIRVRRLALKTYHVRQWGQPTREFRFTESWPAALLTRMFQGGHSIEFRYGPAGFLESVIDSLGRTIRVEHDPQGRVLGLVLVKPRPDTDRRLLAYRYDQAGNVVEGVDAYKHSFRFSYDKHNRMLSKSDQTGYTFRFEYDIQGKCVYSTGQDGLYEVRLNYSPLERRTVVTRGDGGRWTYFYNEAGTVIRIIDPYGGARGLVLDDKGRVTGEVDPNGNLSRLLYRPDGSVYGRMSPLGEFSGDPDRPAPRRYRLADCPLEWEYGQLVDKKTIVVPEAGDIPAGKLPPQFLLLMQRRAALERGAGGSPEPAPWVGEYDDLGLLVRLRKNGQPTPTWSYDPLGNVHRFREENGALYVDEYGSGNVLLRQTDPLGGTVAYRYTASRDIAAVTDQAGNLTEYDYDQKDRVIRVRRHGVVREEYVYDKADNLIEKKDGQGRTLLRFEIGPGNLTTGVKLTSGEEQTLAYDKRGRLTAAATDEMELEFAYDSSGRRIMDSRDGQGVEHRFSRGRPKGNLLETTVLGRFKIHYEYLPGGGVTIHDPGGQVHTVRVLGQGLIQREMASGFQEVSQFDREGRCLIKMQGRRHRDEEPRSQLYVYNAAGDLCRIQDTSKGGTLYEYDAAHRLIGEISPGKDRSRFRYDSAGNLLEKPGLTDVKMLDGNRLENANGRRFHYNERNHVASHEGPGGAVRYTYDSWDRLVRIEAPQGEWQAQYDPLSRRISKTWWGGRIEYYWDSDRLAAEIDQTGRVRVYVYASPLALVPLMFMDYENLEADLASGKRFYPFYNQIGVPTLVEDDLEKTIWSARINPYGDLELAPGSRLDLALRFPGHYMDAETGLHYNRFRYYSPERGRYLQSDPIGLAGGINVYAYPNNPLTHVDLRGLSKICKKTGQILDDEGNPKKELTPAEIEDLKARLAAIEEQLKDPNLSGKQKRALRDQKAGIKGQLADAAPAPQEDQPPGQPQQGDQQFKVPKTGTAKKKDDIPSWVDEQRQNGEDPPRAGESGNDYAKRVCDKQYGEGKYDKGPGSEYSKIKKHVDNDLKDPD